MKVETAPRNVSKYEVEESYRGSHKRLPGNTYIDILLLSKLLQFKGCVVEVPYLLCVLANLLVSH